MFCKHKWVILSETVTKSRLEVFSDNGVTEISGTGLNPASRKHIQIITCEKCGKLKRFVENI